MKRGYRLVKQRFVCSGVLSSIETRLRKIDKNSPLIAVASEFQSVADHVRTTFNPPAKSGRVDGEVQASGEGEIGQNSRTQLSS